MSYMNPQRYRNGDGLAVFLFFRDRVMKAILGRDKKNNRRGE